MPNDAGIQLIRQRYGLAAALARHLGLRPSTISEWRAIPAHHVVAVAHFSGIPREKLRPDIFQPIEKDTKND